MPQPQVVLIGPPGSGKTSVGRLVARALDLPWRDSDEDVEVAAGKPVADIFLDDGEAAFRALEHDAVARAVQEHEGVLSLGGGAILDAETRTLLSDYRAAGGVVVFLDVSLTAAAPRVGLNRSRPLLAGNPRAQWTALMDQRRALYEECATIRVDTSDLTAAQVAEVIAKEVDTRHA